MSSPDRRDGYDDEPGGSRGGTRGTGGTGGPTPEPRWRRQQRLAAVFGDVLPETTEDERDAGSPRRPESAQDRWLRDQVPPHHGD